MVDFVVFNGSVVLTTAALVVVFIPVVVVMIVVVAGSSGVVGSTVTFVDMVIGAIVTGRRVVKLRIRAYP